MPKSYRDSLYCFVDIETTGSKPETSSIIEIAALLYAPPPTPLGKGRLVKSYASLVFCEDIPPKISELTGIEPEDLQGAPSLIPVLRVFKDLLQDHIFVAHNVAFDFNFIHCTSQQVLGEGLFNPQLCTLNLSRLCIPSPKHGLKFLNTHLGIKIPITHRAYADALIALKVFEHCLNALPAEITTTQDLLDYSMGKLNWAK